VTDEQIVVLAKRILAVFAAAGLLGFACLVVVAPRVAGAIVLTVGIMVAILGFFFAVAIVIQDWSDQR